MPSKQKQHKAGSKSKKYCLHLMAEQMTQLQQEITKLQREHKKTRLGSDSFPKPKKLIPKPLGAAGKRNRYKIQEAMGLATDKCLYNSLMASTRHMCRLYLKLDKTQHGQDDTDISLLVIKVQKKHPMLREFANAWPIHDWVQQYLCNHVNDQQNRLADMTKSQGSEDDEDEDASDEEAADASDNDEAPDASDDEAADASNDEAPDAGDNEAADASNDEATDASDDKAADASDKEAPDASDEEAPDASDEEAPDASDNEAPDASDNEAPDASDNKAPDASNNKAPDASDNEAPDASDNKAPDASNNEAPDARDNKAPDARDNKAPDARDNKAPDARDNKAPQGSGPPRLHKQLHKQVTEPERNVQIVRSPTSSKRKLHQSLSLLTDIDTPKKKARHIEAISHICPNEGCKDNLPAHPSGLLLNLFRQLDASLSRPNGEFSRLTLKLEMDICMAIMKEWKRDDMIQSITTNNWEHIFHFPMVHAQALRLKPELKLILSSQEEKEKCLVYKTLLTDLLEQGYRVDISKCLRHFSKLHPFNVGSAITKKARPGYYGPKGAVVFQAMLNKLFDPQTAAINPDIFAPMTLDRFNEFVLIPHITCHLIAEDRKCNIEEAFRVMVASGDAGDLLQPILDSGKDERFDNLLMDIMRKDIKKVIQVHKSKAVQHMYSFD
ncbi:hypothetical protein BDR05DRAFT_1004030 [Suillus weaverae]|nr:hypothetical protein BDR05DRAFT_1004030 [Suillus weaverae]